MKAQGMSVQPIFLFTLLSCLFAGQTMRMSAASPDTGIEGVITISPAHGGPIRVGVPNSKPLAATEFVVENEKGVVASFTTDDAGRFRVAAPPGHYTVSKKEKQGGIGRFGPFDVDVVAGQMTKVEWKCDSGMR
jgi:hypothetical protein